MTIRCVMVGDEPLVAQCADVVIASGLDVVLVSTVNPIVRQHAEERGITVVGPGAELAAALGEHPADVLFSIANLRVLPDAVLEQVSMAINFHDGPLPAYAGLNVTTWAILNGEHRHGITWHLMTADVDAGPVVANDTFPIGDEETAFSLNARCYEAALATFPAIAADIAAQRLATSAQPVGPGRMYRRHDRPAVLLDPRAPARESARAVRALQLGHRLRNGLGVVRLVLDDEVYAVEAAEPSGATVGAVPGSLVAVDAEGLRIATADGDLLVSELSTADGRAVSAVDVAARHGLRSGSAVPPPTAALVEAIAELEPSLSRDELFWLDGMTEDGLLEAAPARDTGWSSAVVELDESADDATIVAAVAVWLARTTSTPTPTLAVTDARTRAVLDRLAPLCRPSVLRCRYEPDGDFSSMRQLVSGELSSHLARQPLLRDAIGRDPRTRGRSHVPAVLVTLGADVTADVAPGERNAASLVISVARDGRLRVDAPADHADPTALDRIAEQLVTLIGGAVGDPSSPVDRLPLLGPLELAALDAINDTALDHDRTVTIDALFAACVAQQADRPALTFGAATLSYRQLDAAAGRLASRLAAAGIGRGDRVGIAVPRGIDMVVGVLATLRRGAAYVPLDPAYPADRIGFMVDDAGISVLLARGETAAELTRPGVTVLDPASDVTTTGDPTPTVDGDGHDAGDLAYVIYTSGSTGVPKGVMLEHRNVVNFFDAMDEVIEHDPPGVWLAVTSLSFDISVLELLWTLTRGFHVVLKADQTAAPAAASAAPARPVSFSLFYFAAGVDAATDRYRLLLESARFGDRNGFEAVWTPERHFHAFGAAYPNPSVTGAALAAVTERIGVRAGSVVLPLHSPIRVAEEWAVVDNLSGGRVAISFAAGWQPNDFVLNPTAFATAKEDLPKSIELVQRLWRGETVSMPGHDGQPVDVHTLPRPVQPELPIWLTSAGSPATFERAGTLGVNVLTHLLGQSVEQLTANIERYRTAWRDAGHQGEGRVTLMMHTYLDRDSATAREVAREPMKGYLGTAVGLLRDVASAFPTFAGRGSGTDDLFKSLTPEELDMLLEVAAARYLGTSGLFGTPAEAVEIVEAVSAAGVDEVACLIDFGIATDDVLASLELLLETKATVDGRRAGDDGQVSAAVESASVTLADEPLDDSVAALVARHGVTHLQCTPSLAAMLVADPADRAALSRLRHLMLGGEALPTALGAEIRGLVPDRFTNMYGPTETTIWSLTHELTEPPAGPIPIGTPIANTTIFVLDAAGARLPMGSVGELHIGGEGVARGYHGRPELTAERFVDRPGMGRVYATGDLVRIHPAGYVEFNGRTDNQVKVRGNRIELGEIETVLDQHPDVVRSVVVARGDSSDVRLVGFVVLHGGAATTTDELRAHVAATLPEAMVPSAIAVLEALPLTPNGKIDRRALPTDIAVPDVVERAVAPPADDMERLVADIWTVELQRPIGRDDNFFDIGGHSLLAVKVFRRLTEASPARLALTDIFRFPTVRTLANHMNSAQGQAPAEPAATTATDRGAMRRRAMSRRSGAPSG